MKLSKETEFTLSVQSLVGMGFLVFTLVSFWFTVQAQIDGKLDKSDYIIPDPPISRVEFDIKDKMVRNQINNIDDNVKAIQEQLSKMEERLYELSK